MRASWAWVLVVAGCSLQEGLDDGRRRDAAAPPPTDPPRADAAPDVPPPSWETGSGARDLAFGIEGIAEVPPVSAMLEDLVLDADGAIVGCGVTVTTGPGDLFVARWTSDGLLDPAFGGGGVSLHQHHPAHAGCHTVAVDAAKRVVAVGRTWTPGAEAMYVARFTADGVLDAGFGGTGFVIDDANAKGLPREVRVLDDGRIAVAYHRSLGFGQFDAVVRLYADDGAKLDERAYDVDGYLQAAWFEGDGSAWLASGPGSLDETAVRHLDADGTASPPGAAVGVTGVVETTALMTGLGGRPLAAASGSYLMALRFRADAAPDPTFGVGGLAARACCDDGLGDARGIGIVPQHEMIVLIGGTDVWQAEQQGAVVLARFSHAGDLDTSFGDQGVLVDVACAAAPGGVCDTQVTSGRADALGRAYAAGYSTSTVTEGVSVFLARYLP